MSKGLLGQDIILKNRAEDLKIQITAISSYNTVTAP